MEGLSSDEDEGGSQVDAGMFWLADAPQLRQQQSTDAAVQFQVRGTTAISRPLMRRIQRAESVGDQCRTRGDPLFLRAGQPDPKGKK